MSECAGIYVRSQMSVSCPIGFTLWSRRITKKHRLIYEIIDTVVHVDVLSAYGHYDDK